MGAISRKRRAMARASGWNKLTPGQQIKALDERLGEGVGSAKQREKLRILRRERSKELRKLEP